MRKSIQPDRVPKLADIVIAAVEADRTKFTCAAVACPCYMWAGPEERESIEQFLNTRVWLIVNLFLTLVVLTADDLLVAFLPKDPWDDILQGVFVVALTVFLADLALQSARDRKGIGTLFWWLDLLASASMLLELTFITSPLVNALGIASGDDTSLAQAGRAARAGSRIGRLLKLLRVLRLVRVFRLFKMLRENPCSPPSTQDDDDEAADASAGSRSEQEQVRSMDGGGHRQVLEKSSYEHMQMMPQSTPQSQLVGFSSSGLETKLDPKSWHSSVRVAPLPHEASNQLKQLLGGELIRSTDVGRTNTKNVCDGEMHRGSMNTHSTFTTSVQGKANGSDTGLDGAGGLDTQQKLLPGGILPSSPNNGTGIYNGTNEYNGGHDDSSAHATAVTHSSRRYKENQRSCSHQDRLDRAYAEVQMARIDEPNAGSSYNSSSQSHQASDSEGKSGSRRQSMGASLDTVRQRDRRRSGKNGIDAGTDAKTQRAASESHHSRLSKPQLSRRRSRGRMALRTIHSKVTMGEVLPHTAPFEISLPTSASFTMFGRGFGTLLNPRKMPRMKSALNQMAAQQLRRKRFAADSTQRKRNVSNSRDVSVDALESGIPAEGLENTSNAGTGSMLFGSFLGLKQLVMGHPTHGEARISSTGNNAPADSIGLSNRSSSHEHSNKGEKKIPGRASGSKGAVAPKVGATRGSRQHPDDDVEMEMQSLQTEGDLSPAYAATIAPRPDLASTTRRADGGQRATNQEKRGGRWSTASTDAPGAEPSATAGNKPPAGVEDSPLAGELFRMRRLDGLKKQQEKKDRKQLRKEQRVSRRDHLAATGTANANARKAGLHQAGMGGSKVIESGSESDIDSDSDERQPSNSGDTYFHKLEKFAEPSAANEATSKAITRVDGGGVGGIVSRRIRLHVMLGVMLILLLLPLLEYQQVCDEEQSTLRGVDDVAGSWLESKLAAAAVRRYDNMLFFVVHGAVYIDHRKKSDELRSFDILKVALESSGGNEGVSSFFQANLTVLGAEEVDQDTVTGRSVEGEWPLKPLGLLSGSSNDTLMWLDVSEANRTEAIWSFGQTHVIIVLLGMIAALLNRDVENLLIRPIERIKQHLMPVRGDAIRWLTLPHNKWSVHFGAEDGESLDTKLMIASIEVLRLSMKKRARVNFRNKTVLQGLRRGSEHFGGVKTLFKGMRRSSIAAGVTPVASPAVVGSVAKGGASSIRGMDQTAFQRIQEKHDRRESVGSLRATDDQNGQSKGSPNTGGGEDVAARNRLQRVRSAGSVLRLARGRAAS